MSQILSLNPVTQYCRPEYPTYEEASNNPYLLKKLPSRWQKSFVTAACVGITGAFILSGCEGKENKYPFIRVQHGCHTDNPEFITGNHNLLFGIHHGGAGAGPFYVAYLTEQEALCIIRTQLEAAGLNLNAKPPAHKVGTEYGLKIGLDLFDWGNNIAIVLLPAWSRINFFMDIKEEFAKKTKLLIEVFHNPGKIVVDGFEGGEKDFEAPTEEQLIEARPIVVNHLMIQINDFIELLRTRGIIE